MARSACEQIRDDLFSYLSTELDPHDFGAYLIDFAEEMQLDGDDWDDKSVADLSDEQIETFAKWLKDTNKASKFVHDDPAFAPAYLMLNAIDKLPKGTWLIHFTDAGAFEAFDRGITLDGLALSTWWENKTFADCSKNLTLDISLHETVFGFAFVADERHVISRGTKYGRNAVLFRSDCALRAYHFGDEEYQAIFPLCSERDAVFIPDIKNGIMFDDTEFDELADLIEYLNKSKKRKKKR